MVEYGSLRDGELRPHWHACGTNDEALAYLADFCRAMTIDPGCASVASRYRIIS